MSLYLDTSLLVSACAAEPESDRVRDWLEANSDQLLLISAWVETEFSAAFAMKVRSGVYSAAQTERVLQVWTTLRDFHLQSVEISTAHFKKAAALAASPQLKLRAGDALHLAIAQGAGAIMVTLDVELAAAGYEAGFGSIVP